MIKAARTLALCLSLATALHAQDDLVVRPEPPKLDDFEADANNDGVPDGWYNARDAKLVDKGGAVGPHYLRFETRKPGRPARLSRAFGIDGRKTEAIVIGLWVRVEQVAQGERLGDEPGLLIDFLGDELRALRRGMLGPWTRSFGPRWMRVSKRIPVPPGTHDAIMSVGLLGATGVLEVDGLTIDLIPAGASESTNLVVNGGFEIGDPSPAGWAVENGGARVMAGFRSTSAVELPRPGARALTGLGVPVQPFGALDLSVAVKGSRLRGAGGAGGSVFFLDDDGSPLDDPATGRPTGTAPLFRWGGSFDWRPDRVQVVVPPRAVRAVIQFEKMDGPGTVWLDNVVVETSPDPSAGSWKPDHVEDDTSDWSRVAPSAKIEPRSALDASHLLDAPAGKHGFVTVRDGRLAFAQGGRARFFGVQLLPPVAYLEPARADALADRLARSGINLVRLGDLDTPLGPDRSLFEDSRDDTKALDPIALAKFDHLIAAMKAKGIYVALELQRRRRFRAGDGVAEPDRLPIGGGPAAVFDPTMRALALDAAKMLIEHVNPETGLALRDEPALARVTLAGEVTLFDLPDNPLPASYDKALKEQAREHNTAGRKLWEKLGVEHWGGLASALRKDRLRVPIAGVSHWKRDPEFAAEQATAALDLIDDRLYWLPPTWLDPDRRSLLWSQDGGLIAGAARKRKPDKPYAVGQWCHQNFGAWALPYEAADAMLASATAASEDWDALVRRGVFVHPEPWGANAAGTGGGEDIFQIPEVLNGIPQVYALWPHAATVMLRAARGTGAEPHPPAPHRPGARARPHTVAGWDPKRGRLVIDTPHTQGLVGWPGAEPAAFETLTIDVQGRYGVVVASSVGPKPIATADRLLVSAVARVAPSGFRWTDHWKRDVADPGVPPLLQEPVMARVRWRHKGTVKAYALDNTGARAGAGTLVQNADGVELVLDGRAGGFHWEIVAE